MPETDRLANCSRRYSLQTMTRFRISRVLRHKHQYLKPAEETVEEESGSTESEAEEEDEQNDGDESGSTESEGSASDEMEDDGPALVTLSDPDVLDCPICLEILTVPVHQCENGHVACSTCCSKINEKCPSCSLPMSLTRCRFIEKVLEAANIACRNKKYGCKHVSKYGKKHDEHDQVCLFSPCECPESSCNFVSSSSKLYSHFVRRHEFLREDLFFDQHISVTLERGPRYLILGAKDENIFILDKFSDETYGSAIKVIQIAPRHSTARYSYDLKAAYEEASITLHSSVESVPKWCADHHPEKKFILVPQYCIASNGQLHLELRINSKA